MTDEAWGKGASVMPASATASFLFCDLVGSTALLTRLGDDAGDDVRRRCFGVFREAVGKHRGTEVKSTGDGLLVLFASSVGDAIGCGIAMQRGIARLDHENPLLGLGLRVGVSVGEASSEEGDWYGTPVVEAARLCAAARSGQILVAELARQLVGTRGAYRFTSLGAMELKGLAPVLVSEVAWEAEPGQSVVPLPAPLESQGQQIFVGRQKERAILDAAWRRAESGTLGAIIATGEQGIGKSRLVAEAARAIHAGGATVLYGRCRTDNPEPYEPFSEALAWYVATAPAGELRSQLGSLGGELARIVPSLLTRFADLPFPDAASAGARRRLFDAVAALLGGAAAASPVLLVLDDLHLAEPPTIALLQHLLEAPAHVRLLVVAVATVASDQPSAVSVLGTQAGVEGISLEGLTEADVELLVAAATGQSASAVANQAAVLRAETDGNPALIGQLLAEVAGTGTTALPCPYKGLAAFQPEDQELFFGREEVVASLLARLAGAPLLAVVGASGSGKSSVVRAGLLPAVWRGALPGSSAWRTVVMAPGPHPLAELAAQLALVLHQGAAGLLRELETDRRALNLAARQMLIGVNPSARVLLVVDQFEELFTICDDDAERAHFLDALLYAVGAPGARTSAVVVMRADLYGSAASVPALASALENNHALLGPMREDELRAAVERPARHVGLRLEPGLADVVIADVADQPGALPLLSHALLETWKQRSGRNLTLDAYRAAGGARGALARTADTVIASMNADRRAIARGILLRLVEVGEETGDTSRRAQLRELNADDPEVAEVLRQLIDARLLTAGESTVEIAHEALIRGWPQLRDWLDEDREGLRLLSHLRNSAHEWDRLGRDPAELQRGARLAATLDWIEEAQPSLDAVERDYLEAGRTAEQAELRAAQQQVRRDAIGKRRLRTLLGATAALLVIALIAGLLAIRQRNRADNTGTLAEARRLGTQALVVDGYDKALLLAVEGRHLDDSLETRANLLATIQRSPDVVGVIRSSDGSGFVDMSITADGKSLLVSGDGPTAGLARYNTVTRHREAFVPERGKTIHAALSPDGRLAVVDYTTGGVTANQYWLQPTDPATLQPIGRPLKALAEIGPTNLSISADDKFIAAVTDITLEGEVTPPGVALVWDMAKGGDPVLQYSFKADTRQRDVAFLPDSKTLLVAGKDGTAVVDIASGKMLRRIDGAFAPIALAPDGVTLAATLDPTTAVTIGLFDVASGHQRLTLAGHRERIGRLAFSPDGTTLASGGDDRLVMVWDVATGVRRAVFAGHDAAVKGLAFARDGAALYSSSLDRSIYTWDLNRSGALVHEVPKGIPPPLAFKSGFMALSGDGARVAFGSRDDFRFQFRDVATGALSVPSDGAHFFAAFSPDGRRYTTEDDAGMIDLWDTASGSLVASAAPPKGTVYAITTFSADGRRLAAVDSDPNLVAHLHVLDASTLRSVGGEFLLPNPPTRLAVLRSDGRQAVAVLSSAGPPWATNVDVIDVASGRVVRSTAVVLGSAARNDAITRDGHTVGLGGTAGKVAIVDAVTGKVSQTFQAHDGFVDSISFAPDGATFVTTGSDGTIKLWDTKTQHLLGTVKPLGANQFVNAWFVGVDTVLIAYGTGELFEWNTGTDAWEAYACTVAGRNLTKAEWSELFPHRTYRKTCASFPPGT